MYYKACTKHYSALPCTTKLAQSTSQYYFVLQSLHKVLPSTTSYYQACAKYVQNIFVLQSLHKALPSIYHFVPQSLRKSKLLHKEVFTQRNFLVHDDNRHCSSKTGSWRQSDKQIEALFTRIFKRKIISAKIEKICWQITIAALMQPLQYELRCPAAKDNSIAHAAAAASNLDAAISLWSATRDLTSAKNYAHVAEHQGRTDYARNDRSRARRTQEVPFIAGCSQFTRKNTRFGAPASSPKQSPRIKIHAAITMRFAAARANSFSTPPLPLVSVTILRRHPLQQHMHIHSARHHLPSSPLALVTTALSHRFP